MKKGMSVMIYQDPVTQTRKEGVAKLKNKLKESSYGDYKLETWQVKFQGEDRTVIRTIRENIYAEVEL